jgi:uncharacterized protein YbbK (DUF523 family)
MPKILISACLLGQKVRYDGSDNLQTHARLQTWIRAGNVVTICPEMAGGLPTPRPPAEIQKINNELRVVTVNGEDVTAQYLAGAQKTLALAQANDVHVAILKARSPSCSSSKIYDGTYSRTLIDGMGVTAALLTQHGIQIFDESQIDAALDAAENYFLNNNSLSS